MTVTDTQAGYIIDSILETLTALYKQTKGGMTYTEEEIISIGKFQFMEIMGALGITEVEIENENYS